IETSGGAPVPGGFGIGKGARRFQNGECGQGAVDSVLVRFGVRRGNWPEAGYTVAVTRGAVLLKMHKCSCKLLCVTASLFVARGAMNFNRRQRPPAELHCSAGMRVRVPAARGSVQAARAVDAIERLKLPSVHRLHGREHSLNQGVLRGIEITIVGGADDVVGPVVIAVIAIQASRHVGPDAPVALIPATFLSFLHIDENNKPQKKAQVSLRAAIQHDSVRKYVPACPLTCGNWPASAPPAPFPLA